MKENFHVFFNALENKVLYSCIREIQWQLHGAAYHLPNHLIKFHKWNIENIWLIVHQKRGHICKENYYHLWKECTFFCLTFYEITHLFYPLNTFTFMANLSQKYHILLFLNIWWNGFMIIYQQKWIVKGKGNWMGLLVEYSK